MRLEHRCQGWGVWGEGLRGGGAWGVWPRDEQGPHGGGDSLNCRVAPQHVYKASFKVGQSCRRLPSACLWWFLDGLVPDGNFPITELKTCFLLASRDAQAGRIGHGLCVLCCIKAAGNEDSCSSCVTLGVVPMGVMAGNTGRTHSLPSMPISGLCHVGADKAAPVHGRRAYGSCLDPSQMLTWLCSLSPHWLAEDKG